MTISRTISPSPSWLTSSKLASAPQQDTATKRVCLSSRSAIASTFDAPMSMRGSSSVPSSGTVSRKRRCAPLRDQLVKQRGSHEPWHT